MATNNFGHLSNILNQVLDKKAINAEIRKETKPSADRWFSEIVAWLQAKKYPLRKNTLTGNAYRVDPLYDKTPTERLHPGDMPLYASMQTPKYNTLSNGIRLVIDNIAEHAPLFFEEVKPHTQIAQGEGMEFWWGVPLPWNPLDGFPDGPRKAIVIQHPGHMPYKEVLDDLYKSGGHESSLDRSLDSAFNNIIAKVIAAR